MEGKSQVSIIIPVYNAERYLRDCVASVLNQKYGNIEVIAVDDGSVDLSASILADLKSQSSVMSVCTLSNQGVSAARNFGIKTRMENMCFSWTQMILYCLMPYLYWLMKLNELMLKWLLSILRLYSQMDLWGKGRLNILFRI